VGGGGREGGREGGKKQEDADAGGMAQRNNKVVSKVTIAGEGTRVGGPVVMVETAPAPESAEEVALEKLRVVSLQVDARARELQQVRRLYGGSIKALLRLY